MQGFQHGAAVRGVYDMLVQGWNLRPPASTMLSWCVLQEKDRQRAAKRAKIEAKLKLSFDEEGEEEEEEEAQQRPQQAGAEEAAGAKSEGEGEGVAADKVRGGGQGAGGSRDGQAKHTFGSTPMLAFAQQSPAHSSATERSAMWLLPPGLGSHAY